MTSHDEVYEPEVIEYLAKLGWSADELHGTRGANVRHKQHTALLVERPTKGWARNDPRVFVLNCTAMRKDTDPLIPRRLFSMEKRGWKTSVMLWYQRAVFDLATIHANAEDRAAKERAYDRFVDEQCRETIGLPYSVASELAYITVDGVTGKIAEVDPRGMINLHALNPNRRGDPHEVRIARIRKLGEFLMREGFIEKKDAS